MASFNDTVDLERAFLRAVTSSIIMARTYMNQGREEMFTTTERQFIFALASNALKDSNSLLTRQVYEYEVGAKIPDSDAASFIGEWNMVEGVASFDAPESLLEKIKEAEVGRQALRVSESVVDLLSNGRVREAVALLKRESMMLGGTKGDRPMVELTDIAARLDLIRDKQKNPQKYCGLKTGLKTFDLKTGGLFPGELTLIAGITGLGKSTFCRSLLTGIVTLNGAKNVLHIANEEYLEQVQYKYDAVLTGIPYQDFKFGSISEEALDRWQKYMQQEMKADGRGQIFVKEVPAFTDVSLIEQQYRILENRGIPIHAILIDHLPHVKPIQQAWGENDEMKKAATDCKELARALRLPVITPTQAATEVEKQSARGQRAGKMSVYGSKGQIHVANTYLIITYKGTDDTQTDREDYERDVFWLCDAKKQRDGPPFYFMAKHHVKIGKVEEIADPSKKLSKEAAKEAAKAVEEAEKQAAGTGKVSAVKTPPAAAQEVPAASPAVPVPKSGLRDASMEFVEAIEGGGEEDQAPALSATESQDIGSAIEEVVGDGSATVPLATKVDAARIARAVQSAPKSTLAALRAKKIPMTGV